MIRAFSGNSLRSDNAMEVFPQPDSPDESERLPTLDRKADIFNRAHWAGPGLILHAEALDGKDRLSAQERLNLGCTISSIDRPTR